MIKRKKRTRMVHRFISVRRREILSVQTNMISVMVVAKVSIFQIQVQTVEKIIKEIGQWIKLNYVKK